MTIEDLLRETIDLPDQAVWDNERTPNTLVMLLRLYGRTPSLFCLNRAIRMDR